MNCKQVATAISSGELERASGWQWLQVRFHLLICKYCRTYLRQIRALGEAARKTLKTDPPDPSRLEALENDLVERCGEARRD